MMSSTAEKLAIDQKQMRPQRLLDWDYALVKQMGGYSLVVKQFPYIGVLGIKNISRRGDALRLAKQYCRSRSARLYK